MQRLGPFAGLQQLLEPTSDDAFVVRGLRAPIAENTEAHAAIEQCLVPWLGDQGNLMDRYDARMLLDDLSAFDSAAATQNPRSEDTDAGATAEELEAERYADLDSSREHVLEGKAAPSAYDGPDSDLATGAQQPRQQQTDSIPHTHQGPAFAFDYGSSGSQPTDTAANRLQPRGPPPPLLPLAGAAARGSRTAEQQAAQYLPPNDRIPVQLESHLPQTQRQHQIIAQTAKFVRNNGNQVEVLLRVKHGGNPNFAFLIPHDRLFPYYRWLVDHAPEETAQQNATSHSQQAEQEHVQQDLQDQEQQQQVRDAHVPTVAAAAAAGLDNNLGALNLLRAYSMNSEADSEPGDCFGQEQQQQQQAEAEQAAYETEPLVYGPALPPPGTSAAANQPYSMEEYGLEQPAQNIPDSLQQTREEQQKQSRSPSPEPIAAAAEPAAPGTEEPVAAAPPDQVKAIIDKLVAFVKKNGIKFELVVRAREVNNPRFSFMQPADQHYEYYRQQLEAAVGAGPVKEFFYKISRDQLQHTTALSAALAPQEAVAAAQTSDAAMDALPAAEAADEGTSADSTVAAAAARVVLKANPRLVVRRPPTLTPAAETLPTAATGQDAGIPEHPGSLVIAEESRSAPVITSDLEGAAEEQQPQLVVPADSSAAQEQTAVGCAAQRQPEQQAVEGSTLAAGDSPGDAAAVTQAQKHLKLQMYLRQKRAEQLAEQQQEEHEAKARAILAHRLLLKRLASSTDTEEDNSPGDEAAVDEAAEYAGSVNSAVQQQAEVEEGEIQEAAATEAAARAEALRLLQGSPEPVDTTLPGLKELARSAAAAQHRAALMVDSDEEKPNVIVQQQQLQQQMLAAALKAAHQAAAAAAGAGLTVAPAVTADPTCAVTPVAAVANMAAAAKAAAAVIAAQAGGVPAALAAGPQVMAPAEPLDTSRAVAAAVAEAAAAAAAAAANRHQVSNGEQVQDQNSASSSGKDNSSSSSSSSSSDEEESGDMQHLTRHRQGGKSLTASPGQRLSRHCSSTLKRGDVKQSSRHKERQRHSRRDRSRSRSRHGGRRKSRSRAHKRSRSPRGKERKHKQHKRHKHSSQQRRHSSVQRSHSSENSGHANDRDTRSQPNRRGASPAALTAVSAAAPQAAYQPPPAAAAPGVPLLDSEQLRQRLRQMMGQVKK